MKISLTASFSERKKADVLIVPFWEGPEEASSIPLPMEAAVIAALGDFKGKNGETVLLYRQTDEKEVRCLLVGLGKRSFLTVETLRRAYSSALQAVRTKKVKNANVVFPAPNSFPVPYEEVVRGICEGIFLSNYAFTQLKGDSLKDCPFVLLESCSFVGVEPKYRKEIDRIQKISYAVHAVRDLVNGNADDVDPKKLQQEALSMGNGVKTSIFGRDRLEKEKMGLLLAVGRASAQDPCLILSSYSGNPQSKEHIVLVGKGVTYDTGGLCLKTPDNMLSMKMDMAGAATVLAAVKIAAELKWKVNVTALAPVAENAIGSRSYKQGDVYRSCIGKTVEILNTDAEGRLILADAIGYAVKHLEPTCIIDIGTLTGGMVVALGEEIAGLFSTDERVAKDLMEASLRTGENLWQMPLHDYKESLRSEIADIANMGGRDAGSMKCALFLREFAGEIPWAHIDMAGPAYFSKPKYYHPQKGTGWGLRLLLDFLAHR